MYRPILEQVLEAFGGKRVLTVAEVARYLGKDPKWVRKYIAMKTSVLTAESLAWQLADL